MLREAFLKIIKIISALILIGISTASNADAAEFKLLDEHPMGCEISLEGLIENGDKEKFYVAFERLGEKVGDQIYFDYHVSVCLNSPGGSYLEGVRLADALLGLGVGTIVEENGRCESACAIIFLAGNISHYESDLIRTRRTIHPTAKLGFHAPSLIIPEGEFTKQEVDAAYEIALKAVAELVQLKVDGMNIPNSLLARILNTPFDRMFYIDNVNLALRYDIQVGEVDFNPGDVLRSLTNICTNAYFTIKDTYEDYANAPEVFEIVESPPDDDRGITNYMLFGGQYFEEGLYSCVIEPAFYSGGSGNWSVKFSDVEHSEDRADSQTLTYPIASWPADTKLQDLHSKNGLSHEEFILHFVATLEQSPNTCGITGAKLRIDNVQNFTNFRQQPGLKANIIGKISLGEVVTAVEPGRYLRTERCASACEGTNQEAINRCIDNNEVWIEVGYNGSRGYLSRKFLREAE